MLKRIIKRGAQSFAAKFGPHTRRYSTSRLLIITYHRILPENDDRIAYEEPGMTVSPDTFRNNLETLARYFEFIKLSDWIEHKQNGQALPRMACAITFDDGWRDNYEFAFPILEQAGIPATIFVVSSMVNSHKLFWPERLARIMGTIAEQFPERWDDPSLSWLRHIGTDYTYDKTAPNREQLSRLIAHAKILPDQEIHQRLNQIEKTMDLHIQPQQPALLSWKQLTEMTRSGLIDVGSHTCNHIRLNNKTPLSIIQDEIVSSKKQIEEFTGRQVQTFCFPNGDFSEEALRLVKQHYHGAVTTRRGWNKEQSDNYMLRRIGVHEDIAKDKKSFLAGISGWI